MKIFKNRWVNITNNNITENLQLEEAITEATDKISSPFCLTNPEYLPSCKENGFLDSQFNFMALESRNKKSSQGLDGMNYQLINDLSIKYKLIRLDIFNEMYKTGEYPTSWTQQYIHFIKKPNSNGVRPIALASCVCKLFETLLKN